MAEIAVRKGVGEDLEPDNDGVELADRPDEGVVNVPVYRHRRHQEAQRCIDGMRQRDVAPCRLYTPCYVQAVGPLNGLRSWGARRTRAGVVLLPFREPNGAQCLRGGSTLYDVGDEQMTGYQ